jgi:hypothetical protein
MIRRDAAPQYRIIVMNRTSRTNLVQDIVASLQIQPKKPYLMLRDGANPDIGIYGIWFQDEAELKTITHTLARLMKGLKQQAIPGGDAPQGSAAAATGAAAGRALLSMLQSSSPPAVSVTQDAQPAPLTAVPATKAPVAGSGELAPAAAALFSSYAASRGVAATPASAASTAPAASTSVGETGSAPAPSALTRKQLQSVLLDLLQVRARGVWEDDLDHAPFTKCHSFSVLQDDAFVDTLHSRYLQTLRRKAGAQ